MSTTSEMGMAGVMVSAETPTRQIDFDEVFAAAVKAHIFSKATNTMFTYVPPVLIGGGTLGNILVIMVARSKKFQHTAIGLLMILLAIGDIIVLNTHLSVLWVAHVFKYNLLPSTDAKCKIGSFLFNLSTDVAAWTVVIITVERALAVLFPLRAKVLCSRRFVAISWVLMAAILTAINIHLIWLVNYQPFQGKHMTVHELCPMKTETKAERQWAAVWYWLNPFMSAFIPCVLIIGLNIAIIWTIIRQKKKHMVEGTKTIAPTAHSSDITRMLLTVSVVFCITMVPHSASPALLPTDMESRNAGVAAVAQKDLLIVVFKFFFYLNYMINFMLYCFSGSRFRQAAKEMLTSCFKCQIQ